MIVNNPLIFRITLLFLSSNLTSVFVVHAGEKKTEYRNKKNKQTSSKKQKLVIIVNPKCSQKNVTIADLKRIYFKKKRRWNNGKKIMFINLDKKDPLRKIFFKLVLNMTPRQIANYWIRQRIKGRGAPPWSAGSFRILRQIVANQAEAVGYIYKKDVNKKVKVLKVNGHSPDSNSYPLTF